MTLKLTLSKPVDTASVEAIKTAVNTVDPTLKVEVDISSKTVSVDPKDPNQPVASEESIRQAVTAAGYSVIN
jgi:copper chaperone CopZ